MYAERLFDYKSISNRPNVLKWKFRDGAQEKPTVKAASNKKE